MAKVVYNGLVPTPSLLGFTVPVTAALGGFFGLLAGQATGIGAGLGIVSGAIAGAIIAYVLATMLPYKTGRWATIGVIGIIGLLTGGAMGLVVGLCAGAILGWCAYWLHLGKYRRSLPPYATTGQVLWHNTFKFICGAILFFLIAPIVTIIPLSFNAQDFFTFTPEMLSLDPAGYSLKHYQDFFTNQDWLRPMKNSLIIAPFATIISVTLGTLAAIGLSQSHVPFRRAIMAILISPMIVPLIISATGMFFFYSQMGLWMEDTFGISKSLSGYIKVILAHAALGIPFVIITVTATLVGFDNSLTRAAANMGATPTVTFFRVQMPLILPGVISGALFAFITSFDEVVVVLFVGAAAQKTLPWQMFTGLREQISPTILAVATILVCVSIMLLATLEILRRRSERLRGMSPT
ncbi:MAG: ABC transporter permease [Loktanella sp.]|nr:ABC transporter permease [bacterium]MDO7558902.1 ABC transporter permease [Loktanella sp.]MDO7607130.1 ABC transporter permease [Loktanella sp.]MDO7622226.1 ABC transporter permease [Loktanella sp.]MDO7624763.1 ABC transporter permease [Loktanella sp.]